MEAWINERKPNMDGILPTNGEEMSISRVGKDLYEKVRLDYVISIDIRNFFFKIKFQRRVIHK